MTRAVVVVPCYNEARRLDLAAIEAFGRRAHDVELLFVNDGSRDETLELLEGLHRSHPRAFSFLHLAKNGGKAEAVRQGVLLALRSEPDYVGFWDADLATPLEDIEAFRRTLDMHSEIEVVVGTRIGLLGHRIERRPARRVLGRLFARVASVTLGTSIFDTQCGAKLFRSSPMLEYCFARPFLTRWIFDVEIFARMAQLSRAAVTRPLREVVYELPLDAWRDVAGSTLKRGDFVKAVGELAAIYWNYLRPGAAPARPLPLARAHRESTLPPARTGEQRAA